MCEFPGVTFHPWVGRHYGRESRFGACLLVLGEAFISENPQGCNYPELANEIVSDWGQNAPDKFFTIIANVLLRRGKHGRDDEAAEIWEHVAYYNLIQRVFPSVGIPPEPDDWCQAVTPFETVLQKLQPDAALILGITRLASNAAPQLREAGIPFRAIRHPRSGVRYPEAIQSFENLLASVPRTAPLK